MLCPASLVTVSSAQGYFKSSFFKGGGAFSVHTPLYPFPSMLTESSYFYSFMCQAFLDLSCMPPTIPERSLFNNGQDEEHPSPYKPLSSTKNRKFKA